MVQALAAFLDFCYLARRSAHDTHTLDAMQEALSLFHKLRVVFVETGVRENLNLPRQHSLEHLIIGIRNFGSPNGLCSSITESKHIEAVKRTWRRSNRNNPIEQMISTLTRLTKMSYARREYGRMGWLHGDALTAARLHLGDKTAIDQQRDQEHLYRAVREAQDVDNEVAHIRLGERSGMLRFKDPVSCYLLCHADRVSM